MNWIMLFGGLYGLLLLGYGMRRWLDGQREKWRDVGNREDRQDI